MTPEHASMILALASASERDREPTAGCPGGRSRWHTAGRLIGEEGLGLSVTDVHRVGGALARRGLAVSKTQFGVTRWTLTQTGAGCARHLSRTMARSGS